MFLLEQLIRWEKSISIDRLLPSGPFWKFKNSAKLISVILPLISAQ